ncbi:DksA/TraR family C4-type zinc finger protein [Escherichia coli]|nr:DksA/TraR family C4-type zinc finger protein [Escherichia coli]
MAVGFGSPDNHLETIQATIDNAIDFARSNLYSGESEEYCIDCDCEIPEKRRLVLKGVKRCVQCQSKVDKVYQERYNRRGSKDSQLR